jgi:hypothetical protein
MDAKQMAVQFPELGTEEEIAATMQRLASIPKLNLDQKRIACTPSGYGRKEGDQGHVLIQSIGGDDVLEGPIAAIDINAENCDTLLRALFNMRRQFRALAEYRASKKQ